jgi:hypothetical protein
MILVALCCANWDRLLCYVALSGTLSGKTKDSLSFNVIKKWGMAAKQSQSKMQKS